MNDIAVIDPNGNAQVAHRETITYEARSPIEQWIKDASAVVEVSKTLGISNWVPDSFRVYKQNKSEDVERTIANVTCAILAAQELGIPPMSALSSFDIIRGRAAPKAITLKAIITSRGHDLWTEERTATRCVVRGKNKNWPKYVDWEFTIENAKILGLADNVNYKKQPATMLEWRAIGIACRQIDPAAILAMPHSAEELNDGPLGEYDDQVKAKATRTRKVKLEVIRPDLPELELVPEAQPVRSIPNLENPVVDKDGVVLDQEIPGLDEFYEEKYENELA